MSLKNLPPRWDTFEPEDVGVEVFINGPDMYVRKDGWEFYLGEDNGPCRPSLDPQHDYVRFYTDKRNGKALVVKEIPEDDVTYEVTFTVRNVYKY